LTYSKIDLHYFAFSIDTPHAHRIRVRYWTAPGRAQELRKVMSNIELRCWPELHNCLTFDTIEAVVGLLMRLSPSLLLQQALEELRAADRDIVMGKKATPLQLTRRAQAVRAVMALMPPQPPERKRKPRRKAKNTMPKIRQLPIQFDSVGPQ
jgi:hypothetical protein